MEVKWKKYGREIKVPALLLLNSWSNSGATPEGIFFNYQDEDVERI